MKRVITVAAMLATVAVSQPAIASPPAPRIAASWSTPPTEYSDQGSPQDVALHVNAAGSTTAVWQAYDAAAGGTRIFGASRQLGGAWSNRVQISSDMPDAASLQLGGAATGTAVVVIWSAEGQLWATSGPDIAHMSTPVPLASNLVEIRPAASLVVTGTGRATVVYAAYVDVGGGMTAARVRSVSLGATGWGSPETIDVNSPSGTYTGVSAAIDQRTDEVVAAWARRDPGQDHVDISSASKPSQGQWSSLGQIARMDGDSAVDIAVASSSVGKQIAAVWQEVDPSYNNYAVWGATYGSTQGWGTPTRFWDPPAGSSSGYAPQPEVGVHVTESSAVVVASWLRHTYPASGATISQVDGVTASGNPRNAATWGSVTNLATDPYEGSGVAMGMAADGTAMVVFGDTGTSTATRTYRNGAWEPRVAAITRSGYLGHAAIAVGAYNIAVTAAVESMLLLSTQDPPEPTAVRGLQLKVEDLRLQPSKARLKVTWQAPTYAGSTRIDKYVVVFSAPGKPSTTQTIRGALTSTLIVDRGPRPGINWTVTVTAYNLGNLSSPPQSATKRVPGFGPKPPGS